LVNALKIAGTILGALPTNEWSPETTAGKEGFVHPVAVNGIAEKATIQFIVGILMMIPCRSITAA
jgi:tripeptide aminopeptidase